MTEDQKEELYKLFIKNNVEQRNAEVKFRQHITNVDGLIFGALLALHANSGNKSLEWVFILSVFLYAVSIILLLIGCARNISAYKKMNQRIADVFQSGETLPQGFLSAERDKKIENCYCWGIVLFVSAILVSFVYLILMNI